MYRTLLITKRLESDVDALKFSCIACHEKANSYDYEVVTVACNLNNVGSLVELLSKCKDCYKFKKAKGSKSLKEFYDYLNSNVLL